MPQVTRTIHIPRPPSIVWTQFTSEAALRGWLAPTIDIDLQEGGAYRIPGADGSTSIKGSCWSSFRKVASCCRGWRRVRTGVSLGGC